jgi:7-cyano-7-deazaguanine synthase
MKIIVLFSGGLDSTVAIADALKQGHEVLPLFINYGQRNYRGERRAVEQVCSHYSLKFKEIDLSGLDFGSNDLTDSSVALPADSDPTKASSTVASSYVPLRNSLFLVVATGYAEVLNFDEIWVGFTNEGQLYTVNPDASPMFLKGLEVALCLGSKRGFEGDPVSFYAPFCHMNKAEIIAYGRSIEAPMDASWTCFSEEEGPCGVCVSCRYREHSFGESRKIGARRFW